MIMFTSTTARATTTLSSSAHKAKLDSSTNVNNLRAAILEYCAYSKLPSETVP